jgi:hypothetical protein
MVEAKPAPVARPIEVRTAAVVGRRAELARLGAAGMVAELLRAFDAAVEPAFPVARTRHALPFSSDPPI